MFDMEKKLMGLWRGRANDRLLKIQELEERNRALEEANACLIRECQTWKSMYQQLQELQVEERKIRKSLYKVIQKIPGYSEA